MSNGSPGAAVHNKALIFTVVTLPRLIIGVAILVGIAINVANIIGRYIFLAPIIWAEEIMIYIMVWCVFIGATLVTWEGRHIKMDLLSVSMPSPFKEIVNFLSAAGIVVISVFVIMQSWKVTGMMARLDQRSVVAEIPMVVPHAAVLFGFAAMGLALLARFRWHMRGEFGSDTDVVVKQVTQVYGEVDAKETSGGKKQK